MRSSNSSGVMIGGAALGFGVVLDEALGVEHVDLPMRMVGGEVAAADVHIGAVRGSDDGFCIVCLTRPNSARLSSSAARCSGSTSVMAPLPCGRSARRIHSRRRNRLEIEDFGTRTHTVTTVRPVAGLVLISLAATVAPSLQPRAQAPWRGASFASPCACTAREQRAEAAPPPESPRAGRD